MATTSKPSAGARRTTASAKRSTASAKRSTSRAKPAAGGNGGSASRSQPQAPESAAQNGHGSVPKAVIAAVAGTAAAGLAGRAVLRHAKPRRVLGVKVPRALDPSRLGKLDVKKVAKQVGKAAERLERAGTSAASAGATAKQVSDQLK